jgi:hypothetical protein
MATALDPETKKQLRQGNRRLAMMITEGCAQVGFEKCRQALGVNQWEMMRIQVQPAKIPLDTICKLIDLFEPDIRRDSQTLVMDLIQEGQERLRRRKRQLPIS